MTLRGKDHLGFLAEICEDLRNYLYYLKNLGLNTVPTSEKIKKFMEADLSPAPSSLKEIEHELRGCTRCKLAAERTHLVFGEGHDRACLMLVGEAPGREEDLVGRPFVGRAGKLLDQMLAAIHITRAEIYITNVVKCRPPRNRTPEPDEIESCLPFLHKQIQVIRPRLICTLGLTSAQALLGTKASLTSLRGQVHRIDNDIKLLVTFHPAYLLRFPQHKRSAWEDLKLLKSLYGDLCTK